jgi:hypothetical protein
MGQRGAHDEKACSKVAQNIPLFGDAEPAIFHQSNGKEKRLRI